MFDWLRMWIAPFIFGLKIAVLILLLGIIGYQYLDIKYLQHQVKERDETIIECNKAKQKLETEKEGVISNLTKLKDYYMNKKCFNVTTPGRPNIQELLEIRPR